jgi:hypothetical protein
MLLFLMLLFLTSLLPSGSLELDCAFFLEEEPMGFRRFVSLLRSIRLLLCNKSEPSLNAVVSGAYPALVC